MYKLVFYVPIDAAEKVKEAVFLAGAGQQGNYEQCCFQSFGKGQFKPLSNANPYIGKCNELTTVDEFRIEMLCAKDKIEHVISALKQAHPYEEPAYDILTTVKI